MLAGLGGGCQTPVGAYGRFTDDGPRMELIGMVADLAGRRMVRRTVQGVAGRIEDAQRLGRVLADEILDAGGREILAEIEG
jgi:hydroxymethylbilane synthase